MPTAIASISLIVSLLSSKASLIKGCSISEWEYAPLLISFKEISSPDLAILTEQFLVEVSMCKIKLKSFSCKDKASKTKEFEKQQDVEIKNEFQPTWESLKNVKPAFKKCF